MVTVAGTEATSVLLLVSVTTALPGAADEMVMYQGTLFGEPRSPYTTDGPDSDVIRHPMRAVIGPRGELLVVAVMTAVPNALTVRLTVAVTELNGIVIEPEPGTASVFGSLLVRLTVVPAIGAGWDNVMVACVALVGVSEAT
jgi:hypothetical protein